MKNTISRWQLAAPEQPRMSSSALLLAALDWANQHGFWQPFHRLLDVKMKTVVYSPVQKLQTAIASIVIGCRYNKDINSRLVPDRPAAQMLDMNHFPDQSQVHRLLTSLDQTNLDQLKLVQFEHLISQGCLPQRPLGQRRRLVVDIDQCGLVANGKSYELSRKGYFPGKKGEKGYQFALAYLAEQHLTLTLRLAPGNVHCSRQMQTLVTESDLRLGMMGAARNEVTYRMDAGYGSLEAALWLQRQGYLFVVKAATNYPQHWVAGVADADWQDFPGQPNVQVAEAGSREGLRVVAFKTTTAKGEVEYSLLLTNLSESEYDAVALWQFYNQRQAIEAFFKSGRQVYGMGNLRSRKYLAIEGFLWLMCLSHNLLVWMKQDIFTSNGVAVGSREMVQKLGQVQVQATLTSEGWELELPRFSTLAAMFVEVFANHWEQLPLRLHET